MQTLHLQIHQKILQIDLTEAAHVSEYFDSIAQGSDGKIEIKEMLATPNASLAAYERVLREANLLIHEDPDPDPEDKTEGPREREAERKQRNPPRGESTESPCLFWMSQDEPLTRVFTITDIPLPVNVWTKQLSPLDQDRIHWAMQGLPAAADLQLAVQIEIYTSRIKGYMDQLLLIFKLVVITLHAKEAKPRPGEMELKRCREALFRVFDLCWKFIPDEAVTMMQHVYRFQSKQFELLPEMAKRLPGHLKIALILAPPRLLTEPQDRDLVVNKNKGKSQPLRVMMLQYHKTKTHISRMLVDPFGTEMGPVTQKQYLSWSACTSQEQADIQFHALKPQKALKRRAVDPIEEMMNQFAAAAGHKKRRA